MSNLDTCMACRFASCSGACHCTVDAEKRAVETLAALHACPKEKFTARGLGDTVARLVAPIAATLGKKGCGGCAKRQAALNKVLPYRESAD